MTNTTTTTGRSAGLACSGRRDGSLPVPRRGVRWRWSAPHDAQSPHDEASGTEADGAPVGAADGGTAPTTVSGRVAAVRNETLVVVREDGSRERVVGTAATNYTTLSRGRSSSSGGAAVHAGDFVGVRGVTNGDGTITASSVTVFTKPPFGSRARR